MASLNLPTIITSNKFNIPCRFGEEQTATCGSHTEPFSHPFINLSVRHLKDKRQEAHWDPEVKDTAVEKNIADALSPSNGYNYVDLNTVHPTGGAYNENSPNPCMFAGSKPSLWTGHVDTPHAKDWDILKTQSDKHIILRGARALFNGYSWNRKFLMIGSLMYLEFSDARGNMTAIDDFPLQTITSKGAAAGSWKIPANQYNKQVFNLTNITSKVSVTAEYWWTIIVNTQLVDFWISDRWK